MDIQLRMFWPNEYSVLNSERIKSALKYSEKPSAIQDSIFDMQNKIIVSLMLAGF